MAFDVYQKDFIGDVKNSKKENINESSFTRQHFTKIADIVKTIKNTDDKQGVVDKLVEMFKKDNSLFDEDKFRSYIEK
ncbi:MAG: hypothetical protein WC346_13245 [Methanogenium sp.]|jgi:tetrahydromethanopterin S-methyltransferase subunit A